MHPERLQADDGHWFRDLDHDGVMDPYEDDRLPISERLQDLLGRMTIAEKAGLMFHTVIEAGSDGTLVEGPGAISKSPTSLVVLDKLMNHFNVHTLPEPRLAARWSNALQALAASTRLGIPVTVSTDPRHSFAQNSGVSFTAGHFSQWPEPLGLAAIADPEIAREFGEIARQEYVAVGIRAALHPTVDLATEPRWGRQMGTFGNDAELVSAYVREYLSAFQGDSLGPGSVACTTKHFPGGGPQKDGEDPHFPYGREQVYPAGMFEYHLKPFREAITAGTSAMMPYYGMPVGLTRDGQAVEEVGFGFNRDLITGLLREELGYDGVVLSDWELVHDNHVGDQVLPARAWGVEDLGPRERMLKILDAGCDQFGGEECPELLLELVEEGLISESRITESAARLLKVKFELGLFDNPFVSEQQAESIVGARTFREAGEAAQGKSIVVLTSAGRAAHLITELDRPKIYIEGMSPTAASLWAQVVSSPEEADIAIIRLPAPWEHRDTLFLEDQFHAGSLEFPAATIDRVRSIAEEIPVIVDVFLDRPALLAPIAEVADALLVNFGASDDALIRVLRGIQETTARLPFEIPSSMQAVAASSPDAPNDTRNPAFPSGHRTEWLIRSSPGRGRLELYR
ncbi:glycoside hydrolase family 3 protein [Pseudarthrobacter scleromae]|uniref:glycoside hydrolase family 3 protein n=1 Tax=Pseudarthrobacter scleromae TaxID=158897 RepID=UPI003D05179F